MATLNLMNLGTSSINYDISNILKVKVLNYEEGWVNYWDLNKFENRLDLMQESIEYFFDHNALNYDQTNDPFWDPKEYYYYA